MKILKCTLPLILVLAAVFLLFPKPVLASPRLVRIGIVTGAQSGTVESEGILRCTDAAGRTLSVGRRAVVELTAGRMLVNGQAASLPMEFQGSNPIKWNGRPYRGNLNLVPCGSGFSVVNVLDVESYLRGVL